MAATNASKADSAKADKEKAPESDLSTYVVTYDVLTFRRPKLSKPGEFDHFRAFQGDRVQLDAETAERAIGYGAVAKPEDAPEVRKQVEALAGPVSDDSELADMSAVELIAYVTQNPDEARRVYEFEAANHARPNVLKATGQQQDDGAGVGAGGTGIQHGS